LSHHEALIYTMVITSAADRDMTDAEFVTMGEMIQYLPIFKGFEMADLTGVMVKCADLMQSEDGLDTAIDMIAEALTPKLRETAYSLACEVAVADLTLSQEELRLLEMLRHGLEIDRLHAAAIEKGAAVRHVTGP